MIQFTITDQHDKKLRVTTPHSWYELTLSQLIDIEDVTQQKAGLIRLFGIITGLNVIDIEQSSDKSLYELIRNVCGFIVDPPDWEKLPCPKHLEIDGISYRIPPNINTMMHGQIELIAQLENPFNDMAEAIAIVMQPMVYKKKNGGAFLFDRMQTEELKAKVMQSRGLDCYGAATFFFRRLRRFMHIGLLNLHQSRKVRQTTTRYYTNWLKVPDSKSLEALPS